MAREIDASREWAQFPTTHVAIGGSNIPASATFRVFDVRCKGLVFEFYQLKRRNYWSVWYPTDSDLSDETESIAITLLFLAGFKPVRFKDDKITWTRPRSRPLWPDTVERFK